MRQFEQFSTLTALSLLAAIATGCGSDETKNPTGPATTTTGTTPASATISFGAAGSTVAEGTEASVVITLNTDAPLDEDVVVTIDEATTTAGSDDYSLSATTVTFPAGSEDGTESSISFEAAEDALVEGTESLTLELGATGATVIAPDAHAITIEDADSATVSIATDALTFPENATVEATVTLTVSGGADASLASAVTIDLTLGGDADTDDVTQLSETVVTFPAGSRTGDTAIVAVDILADTESEADESLTITMSNVVGPASLESDTASVTILDDDLVLVGDAAYGMRHRYDPASNRTETAGLLWSQAFPFAAAYDDDADELYVVDVAFFPPSLTAVDMTTGARRRIGPIGAVTGGVTPAGMVLDPTDGLLYAVDQNDDRLLTVDPTDASITLIGTLTPSIQVLSIALDTGTDTFYVASNNRLYTLDPSTAAITEIGAFGTSTMAEIAFDSTGGVLYGVRQTSTRELVTIDVGTAAVTAIGTIDAFDTILGGLSFNGNTSSLIGVGTTGPIFDVDPTDATGTFAGLAGAGWTPAMAYDATNDVVYGVVEHNRTIVSIDSSTGDGTALSRLSDPNAVIVGLAHDSAGTLYGYDDTSGAIVTIESSTGLVTTVGVAGVDLDALAYGGGVLYGANAATLYAVNTSTGLASSIGALGRSLRGLTYVAATSTLYGSSDQGELVEVDVTTGAATLVDGASGIFPDGLATDAQGRIVTIDQNRRSMAHLDTTTGLATSFNGALMTTALAHDSNAGITYAFDVFRFVSAVDEETGTATTLGRMAFASRGAAFDANGNTLYVTAGTNLYAIDPGTQALTTLGDLGVSLFGLAYDPTADVLYGSDAANLYVIDVATPSATVVGSFGAPYDSVLGLGWDPARGLLYATDAGEYALLTVDPATGAATFTADSLSISPLALTVAK